MFLHVTHMYILRYKTLARTHKHTHTHAHFLSHANTHTHFASLAHTKHTHTHTHTHTPSAQGISRPQCKAHAQGRGAVEAAGGTAALADIRLLPSSAFCVSNCTFF
jgi:hypothetical protein